jgi:hypothetical protein
MGESRIIKVLRVANRDAVALPEVQELFMRAFKEDGLPDAEEAWAWCGSHVVSDDIRVWIARDELMHLSGLVVAEFAPGVWNPLPSLLHAFSESRDTTVALLSEFREWGLSLGQERFRTVNGTGISEKALARMWRMLGKKVGVGGLQVEGQVYSVEFEWSE